MSDLDRVVELLRAHIPEASIMDVLEREAPGWDGKCILDMIQEGRVDEVLQGLSDAFDQPG